MKLKIKLIFFPKFTKINKLKIYRPSYIALDFPKSHLMINLGCIKLAAQRARHDMLPCWLAGWLALFDLC